MDQSKPLDPTLKVAGARRIRTIRLLVNDSKLDSHVLILLFQLVSAEATVLRLCRSAAYSKKIQVVARGTLLLTLLASSCVREMHQVEGKTVKNLFMSDHITLAIEMIFDPLYNWYTKRRKLASCPKYVLSIS